MKHRLIMGVLVGVSLLIVGSYVAFPAKAEPRAFPDAGVQSARPTFGVVPDSSAHSAQPPDPVIVEYAGQLGGPTNAVALSDSTLVLASGPSLLVLDVSAPTHPIELGRLDLLGSMIRDVAIEGDEAYALTDRVTIVDLSDPTRPREIGTYLGLDHDAQTFDVSGDFVYLSGATMSIVDVSDPEHPTLTGTYSTRDRVNNIQVEGENAYILSYQSLEVVDISNPTHPALVDTTELTGIGVDIAMEGKFTYITSRDASTGDLSGILCVVDLSQSPLPTHATCTPHDWSLDVGSLETIPGYVLAANMWGGLRIYRIDDPLHPLLVGEAGVPGGAFDLVLDDAGSVAYVTNSGGGGLFVLDVGDVAGAQSLSWQDLPGMPVSLALAGNHAFVAAEASGLRVVDIANPAQPREVGAFVGWTPITDVAVTGSRAYVTKGAGRALGVLNIANPAYPTLMGSVQLPGEAHGVSVREGYAFVANGGYGLRVVDIADSAQPVVVGAIDTPGNARAVTLSPDGRYAYIADWEAGLRVIAIVDAAHLVEVGFYDTPGLASGVAVASHYAYVADQSRGFLILDVADPAHPVRIGELATLGRAWNVNVVGSLAVIADGNAGVVLVDVSTPTQPAVVASCAARGEARDAVLAGLASIIAESGGGVRLCEVHPPAPWPVGRFVRPGSVGSLAISGDVVYATTGNTLATMDVRDKTQMRQVGLFDKTGGEIILWGRFAYLLNGRLSILDLLDPSEPAELMSTGLGGMAQNFTVAPLNQSLYAVVSAEGPNSLKAIDVAIPTKLRLAASVPDFGFSVAAHGNSIYAGTRGLTIYDFADPSTLRRAGSLSLHNRVTEIAARGSYAYLTDEGYGLRIVDASDPTQPEEVGSLNLRCSTHLALDQSRAVVAGCTSLTIVDVRDPAHPVELGSYDDRTTGLVYDVAASGNYAYLGTLYQGVVALRLLRDRVPGVIDIAGGTLTSTHGDTVVDFPAAAFTEPMTGTYRLLLTDQNTGTRAGIGRTFEVTAVQADSGEPGPPMLGQPVTIEITYTDAEITSGAVDEASLALYRWDGTSWQREPSSDIDLQTNRLTATLDRLGLFAILGDTHRYRFPS